MGFSFFFLFFFCSFLSYDFRDGDEMEIAMDGSKDGEMDGSMQMRPALLSSPLRYSPPSAPRARLCHTRYLTKILY